MPGDPGEVNRAGSTREPRALSVDERVVLLRINALLLDGSPRSLAEDPEHLRLLVATEAEPPPIVVHRPTMRVIDGRHRVAAARRRGAEHIEARFFHGDEAHAFVLAVSSNLAHGLPLSLADRRSAAARILTTHARWSDRAIASVTGLSARTVADVRAGLGDEGAGDARIGRDGRSRPVDGAERRRAAAEIIQRQPDLSLRQVAQRAGISHETARDVRNRLLRGADPVPERTRRGEPEPGAHPGGELAEARERRARDGIMSVVSGMQSSLLRRLRSESAMLGTADGRALVRLLLTHAGESDKWHRIADGIPSHRGGTVAELALECSRLWTEFADRLENGAQADG